MALLGVQKEQSALLLECSETLASWAGHFGGKIATSERFHEGYSVSLLGLPPREQVFLSMKQTKNVASPVYSGFIPGITEIL